MACVGVCHDQLHDGRGRAVSGPAGWGLTPQQATAPPAHHASASNKMMHEGSGSEQAESIVWGLLLHCTTSSVGFAAALHTAAAAARLPCSGAGCAPFPASAAVSSSRPSMPPVGGLVCCSGFWTLCCSLRGAAYRAALFTTDAGFFPAFRSFTPTGFDAPEVPACNRTTRVFLALLLFRAQPAQSSLSTPTRPP